MPSSQSGVLWMNDIPILSDVTIAPGIPRYQRYRWCDYVELRCLTHMDKRFSRDNLAEAVGESKELTSKGGDQAPDPDEFSVEEQENEEDEKFTSESQAIDQTELLSVATFRHLRWRATVFGAAWPFEIDEHAQEITIKVALNNTHYLYLQLLLSALLKYCPKKRSSIYTSTFENLSFHIFKDLMPKGAEVHQFGAGHSSRYTGHLFSRLQKLSLDVRGELRLIKADFPKNDAGDGGLDLVAWHDLKDQRDNIPIAFAQCGCTVTGWPNKMLEASPAMLGKKLVTGHDWSTYYFMPLDLCDERDGKTNWMEWRHVNGIVIDRLRFIRMADADYLETQKVLTKDAVKEALAYKLT